MSLLSVRRARPFRHEMRYTRERRTIIDRSTDRPSAVSSLPVVVLMVLLLLLFALLAWLLA